MNDPQILSEEYWSESQGISADGLTVLVNMLQSLTIDTPQALIWTQKQGFQSLGTCESYGYGISGDGKHVVGKILDNQTHRNIAFIWNLEEGFTYLTTSNEIESTEAHNISSNGKVVVGWAVEIPEEEEEAFIWTLEEGIQKLGTLNDGPISHATAVSANGKIVVGVAIDGQEQIERAFIWSQQKGIRSLGVLEGGMSSHATTLSGDGQIVVGGASKNNGQIEQGFIWTEQEGMRSIDSILLSDYFLPTATAINTDGTIVAGDGWKAYIPRFDAFEKEGFKFAKK